MKVNPTLSNTLTVALQDQYRKLTKLEMLEDGGDLEVSGYIASYDVTPTAVTSEEVAAQNRLTITVKITFKNNKSGNKKYEKTNVGISFYRYSLGYIRWAYGFIFISL